MNHAESRAATDFFNSLLGHDEDHNAVCFANPHAPLLREMVNIAAMNQPALLIGDQLPPAWNKAIESGRRKQQFNLALAVRVAKRGDSTPKLWPDPSKTSLVEIIDPWLAKDGLKRSFEGWRVPCTREMALIDRERSPAAVVALGQRPDALGELSCGIDQRESIYDPGFLHL